MKCKHPYYHYVDGVLTCVQCGQPSPKFKSPDIEDKAFRQHESKPLTAGEKTAAKK
jgi:hypothetical protein